MERRVETTCEADRVPDQGNCDFSTYGPREVFYGKLLKNRPSLPWYPVSHFREASGEGGICFPCLRLPEVSALLRTLDPDGNFFE